MSRQLFSTASTGIAVVEVPHCDGHGHSDLLLASLLILVRTRACVRALLRILVLGSVALILIFRPWKLAITC